MANGEPPDPTRHDEATVALGRERIAELRRRLDNRPLPAAPTGHRAAGTVEPGVSAWSPEAITAQMAAGAERDQLLAQIEELRARVSQLEQALAAVLKAAASGLDPRDGTGAS